MELQAAAILAVIACDDLLKRLSVRIQPLVNLTGRFADVGSAPWDASRGKCLGLIYSVVNHMSFAE